VNLKIQVLYCKIWSNLSKLLVKYRFNKKHKCKVSLDRAVVVGPTLLFYWFLRHPLADCQFEHISNSLRSRDCTSMAFWCGTAPLLHAIRLSLSRRLPSHQDTREAAEDDIEVTSQCFPLENIRIHCTTPQPTLPNHALSHGHAWPDPIMPFAKAMPGPAQRAKRACFFLSFLHILISGYRAIHYLSRIPFISTSNVILFLHNVWWVVSHHPWMNIWEIFWILYGWNQIIPTVRSARHVGKIMTASTR
jgi:hypothetical protein